MDGPADGDSGTSNGGRSGTGSTMDALVDGPGSPLDKLSLGILSGAAFGMLAVSGGAASASAVAGSAAAGVVGAYAYKSVGEDLGALFPEWRRRYDEARDGTAGKDGSRTEEPMQNRVEEAEEAGERSPAGRARDAVGSASDLLGDAGDRIRDADAGDLLRDASDRIRDAADTMPGKVRARYTAGTAGAGLAAGAAALTGASATVPHFGAVGVVGTSAVGGLCTYCAASAASDVSELGSEIRERIREGEIVGRDAGPGESETRERSSDAETSPGQGERAVGDALAERTRDEVKLIGTTEVGDLRVSAFQDREGSDETAQIWRYENDEGAVEVGRRPALSEPPAVFCLTGGSLADTEFNDVRAAPIDQGSLTADADEINSVLTESASSITDSEQEIADALDEHGLLDVERLLIGLASGDRGELMDETAEERRVAGAWNEASVSDRDARVGLRSGHVVDGAEPVLDSIRLVDLSRNWSEASEAVVVAGDDGKVAHVGGESATVPDRIEAEIEGTLNPRGIRVPDRVSASVPDGLGNLVPDRVRALVAPVGGVDRLTGAVGDTIEYLSANGTEPIADYRVEPFDPPTEAPDGVPLLSVEIDDRPGVGRAPDSLVGSLDRGAAGDGRLEQRAKALADASGVDVAADAGGASPEGGADTPFEALVERVRAATGATDAVRGTPEPGTSRADERSGAEVE